MSDFGLELAPPEPTNVQKVKFRRAVMASMGRTSLDPLLKVFTDKNGYGAITKERVLDTSGKLILQETEVFLGTDGNISVAFSTEGAEKGLARTIRADIANRERKEAINTYCAKTGRTRIDAEMIIIDHILSVPSGIRAAEMLLAHLETLGQENTPSLTIDAFTFGELTDRIVKNFVAL